MHPLPYLGSAYRTLESRKISKQEVPTFEEWVDKQEFSSEKDPTKKVKFKSLSEDRQKKVREEYSKKRQEAEGDQPKKKKRPEGVSDKAELKSVKVGGKFKIGDNAKITNSRVHNATVEDAEIKDANILGGNWDKGQKVTGGTWTTDYEPTTIDYLQENFPGAGDAPIRIMKGFIEEGNDPKAGLLKSPKRVSKAISDYVGSTKKWLQGKSENERKILETMSSMKKDVFNNLVSMADSLAEKKKHIPDTGFDRARAERRKGFGKKAEDMKDYSREIKAFTNYLNKTFRELQRNLDQAEINQGRADGFVPLIRHWTREILTCNSRDITDQDLIRFRNLALKELKSYNPRQMKGEYAQLHETLRVLDKLFPEIKLLENRKI